MDMSLLDQVKVQAQVLVPLIKAFQAELGEERANAIAREALKNWAYQAGRQVSTIGTGTPAEKMAAALPLFAAGDALDLQVTKQTSEFLDFNVRTCHRITVSAWMSPGRDRVVPFPVELVALQFNSGELFLGHFDPGWVAGGVHLRPHLEPGFSSGRRNQIHNDLVAHQGFPPPVLANEGKQPVFDLVPLTRARGQVAHGDLQPGLVR